MNEYGNAQGKVGVSSASEFNQAAKIDGPQMESYNPQNDDFNQPYVPQGQMGYGNRNYAQFQSAPGQMPMQNNYQQPMQQHGQYPQMGMNGYQQQSMPNVNVAAMNAQAEEMQRNAMQSGPNGLSAYKNLEQMDNMMGTINNIGGATTSDGSDVNEYAIGVAVDALYTAINVLGDVEVWMPQAKAQLTPKLQKSAAPIIKALKSYVAVIERMK